MPNVPCRARPDHSHATLTTPSRLEPVPPKSSFWLTTGTTQLLPLTRKWQHPSSTSSATLALPGETPSSPPPAMRWHRMTPRSQPWPFLATAKTSSVLARSRTWGEQGCCGVAAGTQVTEELCRQGTHTGQHTGVQSGREGHSFFKNEHRRQPEQVPQGRMRQNPRVMAATLSEHSAAPQHLAWLSRVLITASGTGTVMAKPEPGPLRRHNQRQSCSMAQGPSRSHLCLWKEWRTGLEFRWSSLAHGLRMQVKVSGQARQCHWRLLVHSEFWQISCSKYWKKFYNLLWKITVW